MLISQKPLPSAHPWTKTFPGQFPQAAGASVSPQVVKSGDLGSRGEEAWPTAGQPRAPVQLMARRATAPLRLP